MTPRILAQRIAAMDWSGVSLQHLLAVTAAVETLNALPTMEIVPMPAPDTSDLVVFAPEPAPVSNVLPFPKPRTLRHVRLLTLDGRQFATAGFLPGDPGAAWAWIQETVAHDLSVREDDVGCVEDPEGGGDLVTVEGLPCYRVAHGPV